MKYVLLLPDGSDLWRDENGRIHEPIERARQPDGYVPLDDAIPDGFRQHNVLKDWELSGGVCRPVLLPIPEPTAEQIEAATEFDAKVAEVNADREDAVVLAKFLAEFETKHASPEQKDELLRLLARDYMRRNNIKPAK